MIKLGKILNEIKLVKPGIVGYLDNRKGKKQQPTYAKKLEPIKFNISNFPWEGWWIEYPKGYLNITVKDLSEEENPEQSGWWIDPECGLEEASDWDRSKIIKLAKKYNLKIKHNTI